MKNKKQANLRKEAVILKHLSKKDRDEYIFQKKYWEYCYKMLQEAEEK